MRARNSVMWAAGGVAAALWLLSGGLLVLSGSSPVLGRILRILVPGPAMAQFWTWPMPWSLLLLLLAASAVATVTVLVMTLATRRPEEPPTLVAAWFAVVVAGALTGLAFDGMGILATVPVAGWRAAAMVSIEYGMTGAYWGLVQGWIPALLASRRLAAGRTGAPAGARTGWLATGAVLALVALLVAGSSGREAHRHALAQERAIAEDFPPEQGAAPDPAAPGAPPPTTAPGAVDRDPAWCTLDQTALLMGTQDAATGHRMLSIRLLNFSDAPCTIQGYPDIVFADQNGNELDVAVDPGSSFLAADPGPHPVEIPTGGHAIAFLGWDANATAGALVARALFAAPLPGDIRGSWPVTLDVVEGSRVEITAWRLEGSG